MSHVRNLLHKAFSNGGDPLLTATSPTALADNAPDPPLAAAASARPEIVRPFGLDALAVVQARIRPENRIIYQTEPHNPATDRFRYLRMRLRELWNSGKLRKLVVTSPLAHDGKSTVLLNLATALCERGKRTVLIVDADLHHSTITDSLSLTPWQGLSDCLHESSTPLLAAIKRVDPFGWYLLPAGEPHRNPTELLQTAVLRNTIDRLSQHFDWVLIDSPPVVPLTDALSLQQHVDGSLLVVRAGHTPQEAVGQAVALLDKKNIVGIVLNAVEGGSHLKYQYRYERESESV